MVHLHLLIVHHIIWLYFVQSFHYTNEDFVFVSEKMKARTKIALQAILRFSEKGTVKLMGDVKGRGVIVLIDSGETHEIADELALPITKRNKVWGNHLGRNNSQQTWYL